MEKNQAVQLTAEQKKSLNLRSLYLSLPSTEQEFCVHYFNLINASSSIYNNASDDAKRYIDESIQFARELESLKNEGAN